MVEGRQSGVTRLLWMLEDGREGGREEMRGSEEVRREEHSPMPGSPLDGKSEEA